jgi:hypothetical protein
VHPAAAERVGHGQRRQARPVRQQGCLLVEGRRLVLEEVDGGAAVRRLPGGVGNDRHVIEAEPLRGQELGVDQGLVVSHVSVVGDPELVGGEHHGNRHQRRPVDRTAVQHGPDALRTVHRITSPGGLSPAREIP